MKNNEARRCLLCKKPGCSVLGCPVHTAIPDCIKLYREDRLEEAGRILFENNPLTAITSRICDWKKFCYGSCILNAKKIPVRWYEIEQEISDRYLFTHRLERKSARNGKSVAVVGAGPAGIAATIWLYEAGYDIALYDANPRMGGVLRYGIPPFRLDKKYVDAFERMFKEPGIDFHGGVRIGNDISLNELREAYDAVFLAVGAEKSKALGIPGEELPLVISALEYLKAPASFDLGGRSVVIGGGNVAMDTCRTAVRRCPDVSVYYRKTFENMPANPFEVAEAQREGVRFVTFRAPVAVTPEGVVFRECENVVDPESGKVSTRIVEGTDELVRCDSVIVAISESAELRVFGDVVPETTPFAYVAVGEDNGIPSLGDVFAAGDFILGPKSVVEAVESARKAVEGIKAYLS